MYERLIQKTEVPYDDLIQQWIGKDACSRMNKLEEELAKRYELKKELQFPFGKDYGWGYRYAHKSKPLCYLFFEKGAVTVTISLPDGVIMNHEKVIGSMLPKTKELWEKRYPCGKCGGWIHYRIDNEQELNDILSLVELRCPSKK